MARKPKKQRNAEQVVRQQRVRDAARTKRRPSRDDIARMFLWQMIAGVQNKRTDGRVVLDKLRNEIVEGLERQGFDVRQSEDVFEALVDKYSDGCSPSGRSGISTLTAAQITPDGMVPFAMLARFSRPECLPSFLLSRMRFCRLDYPSLQTAFTKNNVFPPLLPITTFAVESLFLNGCGLVAAFRQALPTRLSQGPDAEMISALAASTRAWLPHRRSSRAVRRPRRRRSR